LASKCRPDATRLPSVSISVAANEPLESPPPDWRNQFELYEGSITALLRLYHGSLKLC
jgi:hypothetical protein